MTETNNIPVPKWYSDLRVWREEHHATGPLWDAFVPAVQERVKMTRYFNLGVGCIVGIVVAKLLL